MISIPAYRLHDALATGLQTCLFRAARDADGSNVLIKTLRDEQPRPKELRKLRYEYDLNLDLDCRGVLRPLDLLRSSNGTAIVFEWFEGLPLADQLDGTGLGVERVLEIGVQIADALTAVHARQVIHKNIQPMSVLVAADSSEVRLTDFGIASRLSSEAGSAVSLTAIEGAIPYISPEQSGRMNRSVDSRSDLYSLGVVLYEMLVGAPPFASDDPLELVHCHIARSPVPPHERSADVPEALSLIVLRLLAKHAEDRYQSARGIREDLEKCLRQWKSTGCLDDLSLSSRDLSSELRVPEKLYGRERELDELMHAFERARSGASEYFVVAGYAGVGKSALVHELHKPIVQRRGYFVSGKFDQFTRDVPYTALIQAFTDLARQILAETPERIAAWRARFEEALGDGAQVIIEMVPELELVMGPQPPLQELSPAEAQIRFNVMFQRFLRACASDDHPLAIFLDDLQWADLSTLQLIKRMSSDRGARNMLQIGAYRDNEVDLHHPLLMTIADLKNGAAQLREITLSPLGMEHLTDLLVDTLQEPRAGCRELAEVLQSKTDGNPFYIRQFIDALQEHGQLRLDAESGHWKWDVEQIRTESTTENVVDLMIKKVRQLPQTTQESLQYAACIGSRFDLDTLAVVSGGTREKVATDLWPAASHGLVRPIGNSYKLVRSSDLSSDLEPMDDLPGVAYRFLHDRVQQAVDALLADDVKKKIHLRIGRLLLERLSPEETEDRLLEIVNHLNHAADLVQDSSEREELAELSLRAGRKAILSSAYDPAVAYLRSGIALLRPDAWETQYSLTHGLHEECAEGEYMRNEIEAGERLVDTVLAQARTPLDKVRVYELRISNFVTQTRMRDACETAIEVLGVLGVPFPKHPTQASVMLGYARLAWKLRKRDPDSLLQLPRMVDEEKLAAMRIMMRVTSAAYQYSLEVYGHVSLTHVATSLAYGNGPHSAYGYASYAALRCYLGDLDGAYRYGRMALELAKSFPLKDQFAVVTFLFNNFHRHWAEPQKSCYQPIIDVQNLFVESGDMEYFAYSLYHPIYDAFFAGVELATVLEWFDQAVETCEHLDLEHALPMAYVGRQMVRNLVGKSDERVRLRGEEYDPEREFSTLLQSGHRSAVYYAHLASAFLAYTFGDYERAEEHTAEAEKLLDSVVAMIVTPALNLVQSLAAAALAAGSTGSARARRLRKIRKNQRKMARWAKFAPKNFQHKYELVEAERLAVLGRDAAAEIAYARAIDGAVENDFPQEEALAGERAALHYARRGMTVSAAAHMRQSHAAYVKWGAYEKAKELREKHGELLADASLAGARELDGRGGAEDLDFESAMRAAQAISGEIVLDRLLEKLVRLVLQTAGAERVVLVRCTAEGNTVEAEGDSSGVRLIEGEALGESERLPSSIVRQAMRLQDALVVDDARASREYAGDAYVAEHGLRSIMALPTLFQGETTGVLYAENNLSSGAFTPGHVEILRLLAAQTGISRENARLFADVTDLNAAYERFVPRAFLRCLAKDSIKEVQLGDQVERDLSVLFADIRSFTTISEGMEPEENFQFLNSYLGRMEPIVLRHGGFIDKYMGDAIMALFEGSADDTVAAAIEMARELTRLNAERENTGEPPIRVGIGVNSGPVMLGTIGGHERMDGTVIGNTVNIAERLEGLTKSFGAGLLVSEQTRARLTDPARYRSRRIGAVEVKGKNQHVDIHEFFDADPENVASAKQASRSTLEDGVSLMEAGDLDGAEARFLEALELWPEDRPIARLLEVVEERRALAQRTASSQTGTGS